jgi:drug/metabolite transporter (DMT)-like permease
LAVVDVAALWAVAVPMLVNLGSIVAVTLGTFYQKRFVASADLRTGACLQFVGALAVVAPLALIGPARFDPTQSLILSLAFSVLVLSIAAIALLLLMIRRGEVARVAALIYLVPPLTAIEAFVLLGESLNAAQIIGMAVTAVGVWLATRRA